MCDKISESAEQASFLKPRDPSIWGWDQRIRFPPMRKLLLNQVLEEEVNAEPTVINTFLRLKPSSEQPTLTALNETTIVTNAPKATLRNKGSGRVVHQYSFSKVFGPDANQKEIFDECVAFQVKDFILGGNCLLFAYGTTNAGKTFTIQGDGSSPGIIPRALDSIFKTIRGQVAGVGRYKPDKVEGIVELDATSMSQELDYKSRVLNWNWDKPLEPIKSGSITCNVSGGSETDFISNTFREMQKTLSDDSPCDVSTDADVVYGVWVSFAEVYNENIYDLLDPIARNRKRVPLRMAQDSDGNTFIRDLKTIHVSSGDEAFHVMLYGKAHLHVAATNMNSHSSRSHCIFIIRLVRYANSDEPSYALVSSFTFCDLAGAERAKKTLNAGDRLKESNNINTSLHVLGRCLATIRENQKKNERKPVPFRDSKLTRIFQRALTGHERISMIVNANTSPVLFDETLNVLKFSAIAKQIVLETPIKKSRPPLKKSRFSVMVSKPNHHGTICWDAPPEDDSSTSGRASSETCIEKYNAQNEELLLLVDRLNQQLSAEKEKNLTLERDVRVKVTETFSKMISDMERNWKTRMEETEERYESRSAWRVAKLEEYYQQKLEVTRKRRRQSDLDDSVVECDSPILEKQVQGLEQDIKILNDKCNALHQLLREAQDLQVSVLAENSTLKFELTHLKSELEKNKCQLAASVMQVDGSPDALSQELQNQLTEEKKKNEVLRGLLEEARQDFIMLTKDKEEACSELSKLQSDFVGKEEELSEAMQSLHEFELQLSHKSRLIEDLEEKYDVMLKTHENCEDGIDQITEMLKEHDETKQAVEEMQAHLESLKLSDLDTGRTESATQTEGRGPKKLRAIVENLAGIIKRSDNDKRLLQNEVQSMKKQLSESVCAKDENMSQAHQHQTEIVALQKDLKNLLQKNIMLEQQLKDVQQELETSCTNFTRTEQELKSALQLSAAQLNSSAPSHNETLAQTVEVLKDWKRKETQNMERMREDLKASRGESLRLEDELRMKESEVSSIHAHRQELINRYEDSFKKVQEELDREKREVISLRDALYKSTPKKNESAEIRQLKELVESLQTELSSKNADVQLSSAKKVPRSGRKIKQESLSNNESIKENVGESSSASMSASKQRRATEADTQYVPGSDSKAKSTKEMPILPPPEPEVKSQRKFRRLFSKQQTPSVDSDEVVEMGEDDLPSTNPKNFMKRSLRNRKV